MKVDRFSQFSKKIYENMSRDESMFDYTERKKGNEISAVTAVSKNDDNLDDFQLDLLDTIDDIAEQFYIIEEISSMANSKGSVLKDELRKLPMKFFDSIDDLVTKNLETKKYAITISKRGEEVEKFNYKLAYEYILENTKITKKILKEVKDKFTEISKPRASTVRVKPKLIEISDKISNYLEGVKGALERGDLTSHRANDIINQPSYKQPLSPVVGSDVEDSDEWSHFISNLGKQQKDEGSEWESYISRHKLDESTFIDKIKRTWDNFLSWFGVNLNTMGNNLEIIKGMIDQSNKYGRKHSI